MFRINRVIVYAAYAALTIGAFAADEYFKSEVSLGLATNLLAGLVVIAFIDTLSRIAEEARRRPVLLATLRINSVACARLHSVIKKMAEHASQFHGDPTIEAMVLPDQTVPITLASLVCHVPSQHTIGTGNSLLQELYQGILSVKEFSNQGLERHGSHQDPEIFLALARLEDSSIFGSALAIYRYNPRTNTRFPADMWSVLIEVHNELRGHIDRAANRYGYDPKSPL